MAEAFNVRPFGYNVLPHSKESGQGSIETSVEKAISSLWEPVLSYLKENENVFSGNVIDEINKANIQTLKLGSAMSEGQPIRNLDTKF